MAVILAADGSHLINETINSTSLKRKQKQTQTCTRKHTLTCLGGQTLAHSSAPTHAVWAEPGEMKSW